MTSHPEQGKIRIRGERLVLRDFVLSDEDAVHAFAGDPVVTRFTDWGPTRWKMPVRSYRSAWHRHDPPTVSSSTLPPSWRVRAN